MKIKLIIIVITLVGLVGGVLFYLNKDFKENNAYFSANFADNVLRPLLGNTNTIKIEKVLLNTQDKLNQVLDQNVAVDSKLIWTPILIDKNDPSNSIIQTASFYPDKQRPYALVHLIKIDTAKINLRAVAGTKEPASEVNMPGPGVIPNEIKNSDKLIAAFNGGFQYRDGQYGMMVDNTTYLPLKVGLATLFVDKHNYVTINEYQNNVDLSQYLVARQNGEMLIKNGVVIPSSTDKLAINWGRSVTSSMYTWRSGIGIESDGKLIYAVGNSLIPETLGEALKSAGAVNAMQLDINPFWVRFSVFKKLDNNTYGHQSLFPKVYDGGNDFLTGDKKDFFYIYLKDGIKIGQPEWKNTTRGWTTGAK